MTYFFYKNLAFGLTLYYYNGYAVFTGQVIYNSWYASAYNVFFTSLPVGILGSLEQDLPASTCLQVHCRRLSVYSPVCLLLTTCSCLPARSSLSCTRVGHATCGSAGRVSSSGC